MKDILEKKVHSTAILLAAGAGRRMGGSVAKQYLPLGGKPVLYYSLKAFQESGTDDIVLVVSPGDAEYVRGEIVRKYGFTKVRGIVEGGRERYFSVWNGLGAVRRTDREQYVLIHDGARPFVTKEIIEETLRCVRAEQACVVGMPVKDTIKIADEAGYISDTPPRSLVWMIQTPQAFAYALVYEAYRKLIEQERELLQKGVRITDDAGVVELFTENRVKLIQGSYENMKITTPEDLLIAEAFLAGQTDTDEAEKE